MTGIDGVLDAVSIALILLGGLLAMAAGIGIVRFPDVLSRMHAATKPQNLGLFAILMAVVLQNPTNPAVITSVVIIVAFQVLTSPVGAHMVGRAAYRAKAFHREDLMVDELAERIERIEAREREAGDRNPE
jgi:multicomponent Na+:H+ antiporter subunit G